MLQRAGTLYIFSAPFSQVILAKISYFTFVFTEIKLFVSDLFFEKEPLCFDLTLTKRQKEVLEDVVKYRITLFFSLAVTVSTVQLPAAESAIK